MSESSLSATYSDIQKVAGLEMGWGRTPSEWTDTNDLDFEMACKEGYRTFLYPVVMQGENKSHNWSFLYPLGTLQLSSANSVTVTDTVQTAWTGPDADNNYIVSWTRSGGIWPMSIVGMTVMVTHYTGDTYTDVVTTRVSDTVIQGSMDTEYAAGPATSFAHTSLFYALPDDFGGMVDDSFTYRRDEQWHLPQINIVGEAEIRKVDRANSGDVYPRWASITPLSPIAQVDGSGAKGTRWAVAFYPRAQQTYEVEYRYHAIPPALSKDSNIYHYGGAEHSQTIIAAVIDALYRRVHSSNEKREEYLSRLRQSIVHDRRNYGTANFGSGNKHGVYGRGALSEFRRNTPTSNITTTFNP